MINCNILFESNVSRVNIIIIGPTPKKNQHYKYHAMHLVSNTSFWLIKIYNIILLEDSIMKVCFNIKYNNLH